MSQTLFDLDQARGRAQRRRAAGVADYVDPARLVLARRLAAMPRTALARRVGVSPAAITQYEKGQSRPTLVVLAELAAALGVEADFFRAGAPMPALSASGAHFRSLRSTSSLERERALAFGEVALCVFAAVETYVDLPAVDLPELEVPADLDIAGATALARQTRAAMDLGTGPIPNVVRLLEARGVAVVALDASSVKVDAFCHQQGARPLVMLNPAKADKARSRFDAAHELGHLVMHHDCEPGSKLIEDQAHAFAAELLTPAASIAADLPTRVDWTRLHALKARWGVSLKALVVRAHRLGALKEATYRRALRELAAAGYPEAGSLGPAEVPVLLPRAVDLLGGVGALERVAAQARLPLATVRRVWEAAGGADQRPVVNLGQMSPTPPSALAPPPLIEQHEDHEQVGDRR